MRQVRTRPDFSETMSPEVSSTAGAPIESGDRRDYDLVLLSDHGMTPSSSYRVLFGETLGRTIEHILDRDATRIRKRALRLDCSTDELDHVALGKR